MTAWPYPLGRTYTQAPPPWRAGFTRPLPPHNRLAVFWRPLLDMGISDLAPVRLRLVEHVTALLTGDDDRWSWCSRVSLPGLRQQVVFHAGLPGYRAAVPDALDPALRSPGWQALLDAVERFGALDWRRRSLVVFQLAQLSYHQVALDLADQVEPDGSAGAERFRYEVARVAASTPGHADRALRAFTDLIDARTPLVRLAAAFQGIGHSLRDARGTEVGRRFERVGRAAAVEPESWVAALVRSRFHRAVSLLREAEGAHASARAEAATAIDLHQAVVTGCADHADRLIAAENERYLIELELRLDPDRVDELCARLAAIDPTCVQARTTIGDSFVAAGRPADAARWYERAGELGTGAAAVAWFRAAQCRAALGDSGGAAHAWGRCLELDPAAVEPREALAALGG